MRSTLALGVLALVSSTYSQEQYTIDPDSVSLSLRQFWCNQQTSECPLICLQYPENSASTQSNTCDPASLTFSCVCQQGETPNVTEYSQTVPFYICQEWGNQCVAGCGQDNACSNDCRANHPCGAQSPVKANSSTLSATSKPTGTGAAATNAQTTATGAVYTGFGGAAATSTGSAKKGAAASAMQVGSSYGLAIVFSGLFAGFALVL
ncbi:hypothetical protein BU16DRAFT_536694 [Lophium mytilinum]|uniref:DUF7707 domain-containing protein n=1 Tax=Lophium mytilinum TaxID=390894 RepID=A0A6A6R2I6_9PEZI|nr:hypothetical protein BU16DRAFT_536694 [Lophium mytilinum]